MTDRTEAFRAFLDALIQKEGSAQGLARAIGMSPTAVLRAAHEQFTLNVENCLRLAAYTGEDPSRVLRLAGKDVMAGLIERLYGPSSTPITDTDRKLLALPPGAKRHIARLVDELCPEP
jgi:hypothetical protein